MAYLVRPWTYRYVLDGKRVPKGTPGAKRVKERARKWYGSGIPDWPKGKKVPLASDKETAKRMLRELVREAEAGEVPHGEFLKARKQPLQEHLDGFGRYLAAKGDTEGYVKQLLYRCRQILDGIDAARLMDLRPAPVVEFLAELRQSVDVQLPEGKDHFTKAETAALLGVHITSLAPMVRRFGLAAVGATNNRRYPRETVEALAQRYSRGAGVSTSNAYLAAIKGFTRWMVENGQLSRDPFAKLKRINSETDIRVRRRTLEPADFARFLAAARRGKKVRGLTGADRAVLYLLAARTGLRASELASLTPASFDFPVPCVTVEAAYSKHRRKDVQPCRRTSPPC